MKKLLTFVFSIFLIKTEFAKPPKSQLASITDPNTHNTENCFFQPLELFCYKFDCFSPKLTEIHSFKSPPFQQLREMDNKRNSASKEQIHLHLRKRLVFHRQTTMKVVKLHFIFLRMKMFLRHIA